MRKKIKYLLKCLLQKEIYLRKQVETPIKIFGNEYGGFGVATEYLFNNTNGGGGKPIIYSFGVGEDLSFECDILKKFDLNIYAFDPTPKSIRWISGQNLPGDLRFFPFGLSNKDSIEKFYLPKNKEFVSGSICLHSGVNEQDSMNVSMKKLSTIMHELEHNEISVLKMDIEGTEFTAIPEILESKVQFNQLLMEIHSRFFKDGYSRAKKLIKMLNLYGYYLAYFSESREELTFVKKIKE